MLQVDDIPSTIPPVNLTTIGGLLGLGFGSGTYVNNSMQTVFSLTLSPQTSDLSWYPGYENFIWPDSVI